MKVKRTKSHLVFRMTRKEFDHLCAIIDLGAQDVESPSDYDGDLKVAMKFYGAPMSEPIGRPKFETVEETE